MTGVVQFDPRDGEAGGKKVRNITVRNSGFKDNAIKVGATVWPSHAHIALKKGDVVTMEGKFSRNESTNNDGDKVVYNNLSVTGLVVHGTLDYGSKAEVENAASTPPEDDEDIPF